ncbi:MAG: acetylornithine/succinylornithine family transaminase [Gammaproteobacteria bacterium]|nr:acetylornithine/succinylornithine family transaminase [Gammaproteobacteria bacterium]
MDRPEQQYAFEVYPKRDIVITRGEGSTLWDDKGNEYIDCAAGIGVASIGHANPAVAKAIGDQAQRLITCPGIFYNDTRAMLMKKLVGIAPDNLNRVFLCNSGTEAMEAALKFARITSGKNGFISAMRGFHGRSMGALSATFKYRQEFEPLIPGHSFVPFNKIDKLTAAVDDNTAAIVLEVVQGEGGVRLADREYLQQVRALCDERNVLLILDEIQTGFARTGSMFGCQTLGVSPDIMTVAKAMAGGFPMGAVLCSEKITSAAGKHGSTFGGNPLACAAASATIDFMLDNDLPTQAKTKGDYFMDKLDQSASAIREVRQLGLMIGIELKTKSRPVIEKLMAHHILALPAGPTVVRLLPPLVISEEELDRVASTLNQILAGMP